MHYVTAINLSPRSIVSSDSELVHYSSFAVLWFLLRLGFDLHPKIV